MFSIILPIVTLIIGAILGLVASYVTHKQNINLKLLEQYFEVRKLIAREIAPLTNIDLSKKWADGELQACKNKVSILYYEHYDLLPSKVLEALMLLELSIADAN
ncbi:MAG: hypothetical protein WB764_11820, partial [Xanthobacteraceae bacterium]